MVSYMTPPDLLRHVSQNFPLVSYMTPPGGVDIMVTNTYQASIEGFQTHMGLNAIEAFNLIKKSLYASNVRYFRDLQQNRKWLLAISTGARNTNAYYLFGTGPISVLVDKKTPA
ncbi:hypothetical protein ACFE04_004063 [Oxalis oulophora]